MYRLERKQTKSDNMKKLLYVLGLSLLCHGSILAQNEGFFCDFNTAGSMDQWSITDANKDNFTWEWREDIGMGEPKGCVRILDTDEERGNDYLTLSSPVSLSAGENHFCFYLSTRTKGYDEDFEILYGTSADPKEMEVLATYADYNAEPGFRFFSIPVTLAEAGDYYFSFHCITDPIGSGMQIDNVTIGQGPFRGIPDLAIANVELPVSSCSLGTAESIAVTVANQGNEAITEFELTYTLNNGTPVSERFTDTIAFESSKTVYFSRKADLSEGRTHIVQVSGSVLKPDGESAEENTGNNSGNDTTVHYGSPAELPFVTDFGSGNAGDWDSPNGTWSHDASQQACHALADSVMTSRCVELKEGENYILSMSYKAGQMSYYTEKYADFQIRYGLSGTPVSEWDIIADFEEEYTHETFATYESFFTPEADGTYSFAVVPVATEATLYLKSITINNLGEYDIRPNDFTLYSKVPAEHAKEGTSAYVSIENRGRQPIDTAIITIKSGETILATSYASLSEADTAVMNVEMTIPDAIIGTTMDITVETSIKGHEDEYPEDNRLTRRMEISDDVLAFDHVTDNMYTELYAIGHPEGRDIPMGLPMSIAKADTLTGFSVGWVQSVATDIDFAIYRWDDATETLGEEVFSITRTKSGSSGQEDYSIPAVMLEAGSYMFTVAFDGLCLVIDKTEGGRFYSIINGVCHRQTSFYGSPSLRAIFGHGKTPRTHDVELSAISQPVEEGPFTANQTITACIQNNGSEIAQGSLHLMIDKTAIGSKAFYLEPYQSTEISFSGDLSTPGQEYALMAYTVMDNDEDPGNDTCQKIVRCSEIADPYVLDFEECLDFSTSGFNPLWTTVDRDGAYTYTIEETSFPGMGEPMAFMAFNPSLTEPAMTDYGMTPYEGDRFGACFANAEESMTNNDWLISPKLKMGQDAKMSFFVKAYDPQYIEEYYVLVSGESDNPDDFQRIGGIRKAPATWEEVTVDLSSYAGKEIYIAINCVSYNAWIFMIDDIRITKPTANENDALASQLSVYPNPASEIITISSTDTPIEQVSLYSVSGKLMFESGDNLNQAAFRYNVSRMAPGVYFANVKTRQGTEVMKFIVR